MLCCGDGEGRRTGKEFLVVSGGAGVISHYTDGSQSKPDGQCRLLGLAGWEFLALEPPPTFYPPLAAV